MSNIINTDNRSNNNIITVTSTNIKNSEKLAESYANASKRDMQECAAYLSAIQSIFAECQRVRDSINVTLSNDLANHVEDSDNPHNVTAEQVNSYTKTETDSLLSEKVNSNTLSTVAVSGDYSDLSNKPAIPDAQIQSDWSQSDNTAKDYIKNKPSIPSSQVNSDWNATSGVAQILNKPTIPDAQVQSDWNETNTSSKAYIQNKPTIPTVPTALSSFTDDLGTSPAHTHSQYLTSHQDISGKQDTSTAVTHTASTAVGSATKGVYVASDGTATAMTYSVEKDVPSNAVFTDTTYSVMTGADGTNAGSSGLVPAPAASDNTKFLCGDGTFKTPDGKTYTFSTGLTDTNDTITVTDYNKLIKNTATGSTAISFGNYSDAKGIGSIAIGNYAKTNTYGSDGIAIGEGAEVTNSGAIQIGPGTNSIGNTLSIGLGYNNYMLLDGALGLIPDARLSSNIARTSAIPTVNNATLTIQKNSTTVDTFTANASSDKTINISVPTTVAELSDSSNYALKTDLNKVYKAAGTVASASDLPTLSASVLGNVYNVTTAFTTTSDFAEGSGKTIQVGNDIAVVNTGTDANPVYKFSVLGDFVDISGKQDASTAVTHTASTGVGSATKGVYIASDGSATAMTYSVEKDVPSNAVFTDTTYTTMTGADGTNAGSSGLVPAPAATDNTKFLKGDGSWGTPTGTQYTFSTGLTDTSGTITVTDYSKLLKNIATGIGSIAFGGQSGATSMYSVAIGQGATANSQYKSSCVAIGNTANVTGSNGIAIGYYSKASSDSSIGLGTDAEATATYAIQLGKGTNSTTKTLSVGFGSAGNYQMLDGTTGLIPDARLSSNIARTSAIPDTTYMQTTSNLVTSVSSSSTDSQYPSAKLFYDTVGNIESLLSQV